MVRETVDSDLTYLVDKWFLESGMTLRNLHSKYQTMHGDGTWHFCQKKLNCFFTLEATRNSYELVRLNVSVRSRSN